jgi:[protein-PII] uridylyltransferase
LSHLCGVLTVNDLNILAAHAFTRKDGSVIDIFQVEDLLPGGAIDDQRLDSIRRDLAAVVEQPEVLPARVDRHVRKWKRTRDASIPVPLRVEFENDLSAGFTIIDIFAPDAPGLLFKITRALSSEGLVISRARISTEANRAIDAFDVQEKGGRKVTRVVRMRQIRSRLENEIL